MKVCRYQQGQDRLYSLFDNQLLCLLLQRASIHIPFLIHGAQAIMGEGSGLGANLVVGGNLPMRGVGGIFDLLAVEEIIGAKRWGWAQAHPQAKWFNP